MCIIICNNIDVKNMQINNKRRVTRRLKLDGVKPFSLLLKVKAWLVEELKG